MTNHVFQDELSGVRRFIRCNILRGTAFSVLPGGSSHGTFEGKSVRFLHRREDGSTGARAHEISAVLVGSGVGTHLA
jgi:hypothetical protein